MYHVAVFCIFLCKGLWSTAHGYYSVDAGHSIVLKQFGPSSCIQDLMRKETYLLTKNMLYKTYLSNFLMLHTGIKNMNDKFLYDMFVDWLYGGTWTLLFLWWTITVEPVLKGSFIEWPPWNSLNKQFIPTMYIHVFFSLCYLQKMWYPIPKTSLM